MRHHFPGWGAALAILIAAGCAGGDQQTGPTATIPGSNFAGQAELGPAVLDQGALQSALALYTVEVDPVTLSATTALKEQRAAQANDDLYELPIGNFLRPDSLQVARVSADAEALNLVYTFSHPFKAPQDFDAPATAQNRIDLGISGRVLFLLDALDLASSTFFDETGSGGGRVIANTSLVGNADGYYNPGGLLNLSGMAANTFPYKVLVDETLDPRTGQADGAPRSNGGDVMGNFDPTFGWTRATSGTNRDAWTGMGFLHQGQTVTSSIRLLKSGLSSQAFRFDVAIIAKYVDPRGGDNTPTKRANRLPATDADLAQFVYRAPHASLDVEAVRFLGEGGGFMPNQISGSELRFHVADWDARATETSMADLAEDTTSASHVALGTSGAPSLAVSIPGVLGPASVIVPMGAGALQDDDSLFGGDPEADSGRPGDALFYAETITKTVTSGQGEGLFTGMVRVTDVEDNLGNSQIIHLDGQLQPVTVNRPRPVVYQAFQVAMDDNNDEPSLILTTPANVASGTSTTITATFANDLNGDAITVEIDWDNDGIYEAVHTINAPYTTPIVWNSTVPKYNNTTLLSLPRTIPVRYTDGVIASPMAYTPGLGFTLGPNQPPVITGMPVLADADIISPAFFEILAGTATIEDPEGDAVTLKVVNSIDATVVSSGTFPIAGLGPYTNPPLTSVDFTVWATDALHPAPGTGPVNGTAFAPLTGVIFEPCVPNIQLFRHEFTSGADGWTPGHTFLPQVFNSDDAPGNSRFWRCPSNGNQGPGVSGGALTTGASFAGCGNNYYDYGPLCDNSIIGPTFSLAGKTDAILRFNSCKNGRTGTVARYRVWVSTDNGLNWNVANILYDTAKTTTGRLYENDVEVSLAAYAGMSNLRLRFQFQDTTNSSFSVGSSSGQYAGWTVDDVRVYACP